MTPTLKNMVKLLRRLEGQRDCTAGIPARKASKPYLEGYGEQYELEQRQAAQESEVNAFLAGLNESINQ